jgi:hypothetical protein
VTKKFVISFDTMGQDREIPDDVRRQVLETVRVFVQHWQRAEQECLTQDRDARIAVMTRDPEAEAAQNERVNEIINKAVEELLAVEQPEDAPPIDEEYRKLEVENLRLKTQARMFIPDGELHDSIKEIQNYHTIKMPRIIQALMFLMKIDHDSICEPHSNRLFWKHARTHIGDLLNRVNEYVILGKKEDNFLGYQTLNYVDKITGEITPEEVDSYHPAFARLFKWLHAAVALRKQDIIRRKAIAKRDREHRDQRIDEKQQRDIARQTALQEANDAWLAAN